MPGASSKQFLWVALVSHGEVALNTEHLVQAERPSTVQGAVTRSWQSSRSKSRVPPHSPSCWGGPAVSAGVGAPEKPPEQPPNGCSTARIFRNLSGPSAPSSLRTASRCLHNSSPCQPPAGPAPDWPNAPCAPSWRSVALHRDLYVVHDLPGATEIPQNPRSSSGRCLAVLMSLKMPPHTGAVCHRNQTRTGESGQRTEQHEGGSINYLWAFRLS